MVVVLAWEGMKHGINRLCRWSCGRRWAGTDCATRSVGTQTSTTPVPSTDSLTLTEGLRRRSPFHAGGAPTRVAESIPTPTTVPRPPPIPDPPAHPPASTSVSAGIAPGLPTPPEEAPAPRRPTVPPPPAVLYGERVLTTTSGHCFHLPGCTQLVNTRAPGVRRPCQLCFPTGASKDTLARVNGLYGDPFMYHSIRRCGNQQGESVWLTPCCHCLPDPERYRKRAQP